MSEDIDLHTSGLYGNNVGTMLVQCEYNVGTMWALCGNNIGEPALFLHCAHIVLTLCPHCTNIVPLQIRNLPKY